MSYYRISPLTTTNDISTNPPAPLAALKEVAKFSENSDARANLERCGHELLELTRPIICRDDIDVKFTV
jgi:hypothetical protein